MVGCNPVRNTTLLVKAWWYSIWQIIPYSNHTVTLIGFGGGMPNIRWLPYAQSLYSYGGSLMPSQVILSLHFLTADNTITFISYSGPSSFCNQEKSAKSCFGGSGRLFPSFFNQKNQRKCLF